MQKNIRSIPLLFLLAGMAASLAACSYFRSSSDLGKGPPKVEEEAITPSQEKNLPFDKAAARIEASLQKGDAAAKNDRLDEARQEYNKALKLLLTVTDRGLEGEWRMRFDQLFLRANLASIRLARVRGVMLGIEPQGTELGISFNAQVERWLTFYLTTGRGSMQRYLQRMGAYNAMIEQILAEKNLPSDLKYLPIIESGFSPYAYSPAAACGLWQFIPGTGRRFGLTVNDWVDERRDPVKATRAAADYLTVLYNMFNDWALALAAYNCGEDRVGDAIRAVGKKNYWDLPLPGETVNYVPKFFAAMMIAKEPELYGFYVEPDPPIRIEKLHLEGVVDLRKLAERTGVDYTELKDLNPELLDTHTPPEAAAYDLNIPDAQAEGIRAAVADLSSDELYVPRSEIEKLKQPSRARGSAIVYKVKKGDTLGGIARRYKTTVASIKRLNHLKGNSIRPGSKLKILPGSKS